MAAAIAGPGQTRIPRMLPKFAVESGILGVLDLRLEADATGGGASPAAIRGPNQGNGDSQLQRVARAVKQVNAVSDPTQNGSKIVFGGDRRGQQDDVINTAGRQSFSGCKTDGTAGAMTDHKHLVLRKSLPVSGDLMGELATAFTGVRPINLIRQNSPVAMRPFDRNDADGHMKLRHRLGKGFGGGLEASRPINGENHLAQPGIADG